MERTIAQGGVRRLRHMSLHVVPSMPGVQGEQRKEAPSCLPMTFGVRRAAQVLRQHGVLLRPAHPGEHPVHEAGREGVLLWPSHFAGCAVAIELLKEMTIGLN